MHCKALQDHVPQLHDLRSVVGASSHLHNPNEPSPERLYHTTSSANTTVNHDLVPHLTGRYTVMELQNVAQIKLLMQQGSSGSKPPRIRAPAGGSSMAPGRPPLAAATPVPFQPYALPVDGCGLPRFLALPAPPIFSVSPLGSGLANQTSAPGTSGASASASQAITASGQGSGHEAQSPLKHRAHTSAAERYTPSQVCHIFHLS